MKPVIKRMWVKALRSGQYKQTTQQLRDDDKFCCLGVLCDLHAKATGKSKWDGSVFQTRAYHDSMEVPKPVQRWAGLRDCNPSVQGRRVHGELCTSLAELNDNGYGFKRIATVIEKEL